MSKLLILVFIATISYADWCIYYSSQLKIHGDEDRKFLKKYRPSKIVKHKKYYRFIIGPFKDKNEALKRYKKLKRIKPDIFLKECAGDQEVEKKPQKARKIVTQSDEVNLSDTLFANKELDNLTRKEVESFYEFSFYEFIHRLMNESVDSKIDIYRYRIEKLNALLENSRYNLDLFAQASLTYSKFIDYDLNENKELSAKYGLGFDKRIYDSGYRFVKDIIELKEKLSHLRYLQSRDKLYLLGVEIYLQTYLNQYKKESYEHMFFEQKTVMELAKERYKSGVASKVDFLNAKDDYLQLKMDLIERIYSYLYSDFILRNLVGLDVKKPLKLKEFGVEEKKKNLKAYILEAYRNNRSILMKKVDYLLSKERLNASRYYYMPQVDIHGEIYHEYRKDYSYKPHKSTTGLNYLLGLNIKIPLYNQRYFDEKQRAKLITLKSKEELKKEFFEVSKEIHKSYNELEKLDQKIEIVKEQLNLANERFELTKKRYISGIGRYEDLAMAIKRLIRKKIELRTFKNLYLKNLVYLKILEGKQRLYE